MGKKRFAPRITTCEIPTSSMADVAFLLIVFFLVNAAFAATRGLDVGLPAEDDTSQAIEPVEAVLVEVRREGGLRVDRDTVPLAGLLPYLAPKLRANPSKPVIVRAMEGCRYEQVVDVLDLLRGGSERLGLERPIEIALPTEREIALYWPDG